MRKERASLTQFKGSLQKYGTWGVLMRPIHALEARTRTGLYERLPERSEPAEAESQRRISNLTFSRNCEN